MLFPHHTRRATLKPSAASLFAVWPAGLLAVVFVLACLPVAAQPIPARLDPRSRTPQEWVAASAVNEVPMIQYDMPYLRFHMLYKGQRGLELRDEIESRDGMVARVISKEGQPLTPQQDADERER